MIKYDKLNPVQLGLLEKNIIDLAGEVNADMAWYVREAILRLTARGAPDIAIIITSEGGSVDVGLDIYDFLTHYPGKKTGIVMGFAKSMAVLILQACERRMCGLHGSVMIHHVSKRSISLDVLEDAAKVNEKLADLRKSQTLLYDILSKRTKRTIEEIREECRKERDMTAEEALQFGLIDEISREYEKPLE